VEQWLFFVILNDVKDISLS